MGPREELTVLPLDNYNTKRVMLINLTHNSNMKGENPI
jgi:hypothetical protein